MTELEREAPAGGRHGTSEESQLSPEELLDLLRRERANFLNYKRRVEQERLVDRERAQVDVLLRLLPVLDELDRALAERPQSLESHPWAAGVALIHRRLAEAFSDLAVERIGVEGELFDPERHEAVLYDGQPDATERRVKSVFRPGYTVGGRLLRPAQVTVVGTTEPVGAKAGPGRAQSGQSNHSSKQHNGTGG